MKPDLILLTNEFPASHARAENWLYDELKHTHAFFNQIKVVPENYSNANNPLPPNCKVLNWKEGSSSQLNLSEIKNCLSIVLSDFKGYPSKLQFLKSLRYNLALVKYLHLKAKKIATLKELFVNTPILYAYWADNLATTACIISQRYHKAPIVTRGHGYEVFEEQTKDGIIPFRGFQYRRLTKIYTDSRRGMMHLNSNKHHARYQSKNACSYVGTADRGEGVFLPEAVFSIVSCSYIRDIKRLHLMADILKHVSFPLVWHVLGAGEDLERVKQTTQDLPSHIKVIFYGELSNEAILEFYKQTTLNLFVSLSRSEGLPVSMMEALSFGIPIMSTDVGGCHEICNELTGFLIEKDFNPETIAAKLTEFKSSNKNTQNFRQQCRNFWLENFNAQSNYKKFAQEIAQLK